MDANTSFPTVSSPCSAWWLRIDKATFSGNWKKLKDNFINQEVEPCWLALPKQHNGVIWCGFQMLLPEGQGQQYVEAPSDQGALPGGGSVREAVGVLREAVLCKSFWQPAEDAVCCRRSAWRVSSK